MNDSWKLGAVEVELDGTLFLFKLPLELEAVGSFRRVISSVGNLAY